MKSPKDPTKGLVGCLGIISVNTESEITFLMIRMTLGKSLV